MLAGAALTAHEAAGDAAGGVEFFLKLDAQGEEVNTVARLVAHRNVAQHAGLAVADHRAAVGQATHFAGFDHKGAARKGRLELAVLGEGFQSGCEFVSHRDSPSLVDFYFQRSPAPILYNKASSQASCLGARFTAQNGGGAAVKYRCSGVSGVHCRKRARADMESAHGAVGDAAPTITANCARIKKSGRVQMHPARFCENYLRRPSSAIRAR